MGENNWKRYLIIFQSLKPGPTPSNTISGFTLVVLTPDGPRHKSFVPLTARLKSYKTWKHEVKRVG